MELEYASALSKIVSNTLKRVEYAYDMVPRKNTSGVVWRDAIVVVVVVAI
jgi:hypothetical protein